MRLRGDSRHLCRTLSEKISPGRPVGRPSTVVCRRLAGSGLLTCTCSRRAGAGFRGGAPKQRSGPESLWWRPRVRRCAANLTPGKSCSSTRESTCSCARRHRSSKLGKAAPANCSAVCSFKARRFFNGFKSGEPRYERERESERKSRDRKRRAKARDPPQTSALGVTRQRRARGCPRASKPCLPAAPRVSHRTLRRDG